MFEIITNTPLLAEFARPPEKRLHSAPVVEYTFPIRKECYTGLAHEYVMAPGRTSDFSHGVSRLSKHNFSPYSSRRFPYHVVHMVGRLLRVHSVYVLYHYLQRTEVSSSVFWFICLLSSGVLFILIERPWRGRPLSTSQIVPSIVNGAFLASALFLWGKGLKADGPIRALLAEYTGATLGAVSTLFLGGPIQRWKKMGGLSAMLIAFYLLSQGWAMGSYSPFSKERKQQGVQIGLWSMSTPILAGLLLALRRVIARRITMKKQLKTRLYVLTVLSAACFMFPFAVLQLATSGKASERASGQIAWAYVSTIVFGIVLAYYVDIYVEERLHVFTSSPTHLLVTAFCIISFEFLYGMDFSLIGFLMCSAILGIGIFEATSAGFVHHKWPQDNADALKEFEAPLSFSPLPPSLQI